MSRGAEALLRWGGRSGAGARQCPHLAALFLVASLPHAIHLRRPDALFHRVDVHGLVIGARSGLSTGLDAALRVYRYRPGLLGLSPTAQTRSLAHFGQVPARGETTSRKAVRAAKPSALPRCLSVLTQVFAQQVSLALASAVQESFLQELLAVRS